MNDGKHCAQKQYPGINTAGLVWDEKRGKFDRYNRPDLVFLLDGVLPDVQNGD